MRAPIGLVLLVLAFALGVLFVTRAQRPVQPERVLHSTEADTTEESTVFADQPSEVLPTDRQATVPAPQEPTQRLSGLVLLPGGRPASGIPVRLHSSVGLAAEVVTDTAGVFVIDPFPLDVVHGVDIDGAAVEATAIPRRVFYCDPAGIAKYGRPWPLGNFVALVGAVDGRTVSDVTIQLVPRSSLSGRVVRHGDFEPVAGATVRAESWFEPAPRPPSVELVTNDEGRFEGIALPGRYKIEVRHTVRSPATGLPLAGVVPFSIDVLVGGAVDLGDLVLGQPGATLVGRVIDDRSSGVAALPVRAVLAEATATGEPPNSTGTVLAEGQTDEAGGFRLVDLPPVPVLVHVGLGEYEPTGEITGKRLATWVDPVEVDLRHVGSDRTVAVGDIVCRLSRPFSIRLVATIEPNPGAPDVVASLRPVAEGQAAEPPHPPLRHRPFLPVTRTLTPGASECSWSLFTPHPPVVLTVRRGERTVYSEVVIPAAHAVHEVRVHVP